VKIFVAGASGALGLPTLRLLVANGHDVIGMTSSEAKRATLDETGVRVAVADALDAGATRRAIESAAPDAIACLLTRLPQRGPMMPRDLKANAAVQTRGTASVAAAARAAGTARIVVQSIVFRYGYDGREELLEEDAPIHETAPVRSIQFAADGLRDMEKSGLDAGAMILRYGAFYGATAGHMKTVTTMLKRRMPLLPGPASGELSWIHLDDAATATVAALERGTPGEIYNVCDDEPVSFAAFARELAATTGLPAPRSAPLWLAKIATPYAALFSNVSVRCSNAKAKRELGWTPRFPTIRDGLRHDAAALRS